MRRPLDAQRDDTLTFIHEMLGELSQLAQRERHDMLVYLIEMAQIESSDLILSRASRAGKGQRDISS